MKPGFVSGLLRSLLAALIAPLAAAVPVLTVGYAAYLTGSASYVLYVEAFFQVLTQAWPVAVIVGLPLHFVLRRLGLQSALVYALAGAAIAWVTAWLIADGDTQDIGEWAFGRGLALVLYGAFAGWLFRRRLGG